MRAEGFPVTESSSAVRLLEVEPDVARFLTEEERTGASRLLLPVEVIRKGPAALSTLLGEHGAFGALILEGMLMNRRRVGHQATMRLLGPGDILTVSDAPRSMLLGPADWRVAVTTRVAMLGDEALAAVRRWPRLAAGIYVRVGEQADRLIAQLAICQLPRVEDRALALLWLLAESWGHVGPAGTSLPVTLTHDALGALIGARRSTVTLALGALAERGAIVRQERGWLLLETPPDVPADDDPWVEEPTLLSDEHTAWAQTIDDEDEERSDYETLIATIATLREEHLRSRERVSELLEKLSVERERCADVRRRISREGVTRRAPSSRSNLIGRPGRTARAAGASPGTGRPGRDGRSPPP
jgi:CRP/FNR family transcriptional regulator, cyclic AMP receptor protein